MGFLIIVAGIAGAFFWNTPIAIVTSSAGIVSEAAAALLLAQNNRARGGMDECQNDLVRMRNLSRALQITNTASISPAEREKRITGIVDELIGRKES